MADGGGVEVLLPLVVPAVQRHTMQRCGISVFVDDFVSLDAEPSMSADKCLLPEAQGHEGQTGDPNQSDSRRLP
jgi:hypothetical protein